ncbi:hypothetical protein GQF61_15960 [Sphingobacterium sp. DK4209]|uniref:Glycosyltransferase n=1 Tax=Sphingobacterium zhuxiongii TaxID=2662364 RepID=A0A5Q0QGB1_9SPHI|nr:MULTISPECIES: hypothetical protein [unclassified Sphingobacterium]MVZ67351.1 hypothetical protein [Sphingobacterium sp. DK4209]QGA26938.1 hypothetical protein GFH32_11700 [Sphingobacterium sp. dk4302]
MEVNGQGANDRKLERQIEKFIKEEKFDLTYIHRLSNGIGIFQHAIYQIPNYHHGYCLDDVSRALYLLALSNRSWDKLLEESLFRTYLSFIQYAQTEEGIFRNFMNFENQFLDETASDDSIARCIWSLGFVLSQPSWSSYHPIICDLFNRGMPTIKSFKSVRAVAYSLMGLVHALEFSPGDEQYHRIAFQFATFLADEFQTNSTATWPWYENIITYDNSIIPLSLLRASQYFNSSAWASIAYESILFLEASTFPANHFSGIGNAGWYIKNERPNRNGQQAIEIPSTIMLYLQLYHENEESNYLNRARQAFLWYLGENDQKQSLFNAEEKSCYDGLESYGVNKNQGAESNIAFWTSYKLIQQFHNPF